MTGSLLSAFGSSGFRLGMSGLYPLPCFSLREIFYDGQLGDRLRLYIALSKDLVRF